MNEWWSALDVFQKVLYCISIPSTLLLLVQTIMVLCGWGDGGEAINGSDTSGIDFDTASTADVSGHMSTLSDASGATDIGHDLSADAHHIDSNPGDFGNLRLFTLQTIVAFLCVYGWTAIIMYSSGKPAWISSIIGLILGVIVMYAIAKIVQQTSRLVANGTFEPRNALGVEGSVYIPIPAKRCGNGKVNVIVQGSLMECDAMTDNEEMLPTNMKVRVVDVIGETLVVEKVE